MRPPKYQGSGGDEENPAEGEEGDGAADGGGGAGDGEPVDYGSWSVKELKQALARAGVNHGWANTKEDLVALAAERRVRPAPGFGDDAPRVFGWDAPGLDPADDGAELEGGGGDGGGGVAAPGALHGPLTESGEGVGLLLDGGVCGAAAVGGGDVEGGGSSAETVSASSELDGGTKCGDGGALEVRAAEAAAATNGPAAEAPAVTAAALSLHRAAEQAVSANGAFSPNAESTAAPAAIHGVGGATDKAPIGSAAAHGVNGAADAAPIVKGAAPAVTPDALEQGAAAGLAAQAAPLVNGAAPAVLVAGGPEQGGAEAQGAAARGGSD